ncbi:RHS repeat-associated protein [Kitasatospora sp. MAA4]|uniref:RHS repeat-associated core domain-containing protein n=1 Tax=Kitasatospora sp. MAA4 TaxID=3035093 RepID=UPI00247300C5|nr:RHS repeat-associated core domain-containing protein [Kitasatospora sp. MAA4]MDH6132205.1 RHS repeat-associated protein [Kitasatospora sp. MAA4]
MGRQITEALEHVATKAGQGLAEDFGGSYQKILKDTHGKATSVADRTAEHESGVVDHLNGTGKGEPGKGSVPDPHPDEHPPAGNPDTPPGGPTNAVRDDFEPDLSGGGPRGGQRSDGNEGTETGGTDPVDLVSGQVITSATDLDIAGLLPILLRRAYASGYQGGTLFGPGWSGTLTQRVQVDLEGIHFAGDDGQLLHYPVPAQPGQQVLPQEGARWPLTWDHTDDVIRIHDPETGWTRHFAATGTPDDTPAARRAGRTVRPLTALTERNGHRLDFVRDDDRLPVELRHSSGRRVAIDLVRTAAGPRIEGLRLLDGSAGGLGTTVVTFAYDARGRLTDHVNSSGLPLVYAYDGQDRITSWTDRTGHRYSYEYDAVGRVVRGHGPSGALSVTIAYDPERRVNTVTDSHGGRTEYHYDEHQHLSRITDPLGHSVRVQHDRYNRLLRYTDQLGHSTRLTRNELGDVVRVDRPDGSSLLIGYNALRRPVEIQTPEGLSWRQAYDERGNRTEVTDRAGVTTRFGYDEAGRLTGVTDALGHTTRITCDPAGLPIESVDALGARSVLQRDAFGRPAAATDPLGTTVRFGWTVEGYPLSRTLTGGGTEWWTYDAEGNNLTHTDAEGGVTTLEYTHFHLLTARTDPDGAHYRFRHDRLLQLAEVTNPQGLSWSYRYDEAGRLASEQDFDGRTVNYRYSDANQVLQRENGAGQRVDFTYDPLGRLASKTVGGATTDYAYDPANRLVAARTADCELTRRYDPVGRLLAETVDGRTVSIGYDELGRRVSRRTPSGSVSRWTYDAVGNPQSLTADDHLIGFEHDALGRETGRSFGPDLALGFGWDAAGRQTGRTTTVGGADLLHRAYSYAGDGGLTGITDRAADGSTEHTGIELDRAGRVTAVRAADWTESYAYDAAGHLADAAWPGQRETAAQGERAYQGARLHRAGRIDYRYDAEGRVIGRRQRTLSGQTRTWRYSWDAEDRLTDVVTPDGAHWHYRYDPLGRRIAKQQLIEVDGELTVLQWTSFSWHEQTLIEQTAHSPQLPGPYTLSWEYQGLHPIAQRERLATGADDQQEVDERFFAIVTDLVGTPVQLLAPDGSTAWEQRATIWGVPIAAGRQATDTPLRFPGQYYDPESRLHYNVHRYYDPAAARYLTVDPLGLSPSPDAYGYAGNPLLACDPLGLMLRNAQGQFMANPNAVPPAHNRRSEYPSGYRVPTHNHMIQHWTDEGVAQNTAHPVDANGVPIPESQLTWRDANGQVVPYNNVTYEHVNPVVNHWNTTGYNTDRAARNDYYNNTANLEVMDGGQNSAGGGRMTQRYRQDTGPNYSRT